MKIAFVARQPGTAHAFETWLAHLRSERKSWRTQVFYYPEAAGHIHGEPVVAEAQLRRKLHEWAPDCIVTGTSLTVEDDVACWIWAKEAAIPCMAVAESWVNLPARFILNGSLVTPDWIAVPDARAASALVQAGIDAHRIRELGNPLLDEARSRQGAMHEGTRILFVTEPPLPEMGESLFREKFGQLDADLFAHLICALKNEPAMRDALTVRLHPRDSRQAFLRRVQGSLARFGIQTRVGEFDWDWDQKSKWDCLHSARVAVGLGSMLLHEAAACGIPVMALRIGSAEAFSELVSLPGVVRLQVADGISACMQNLWTMSRSDRHADGIDQTAPSCLRLIAVLEEMVSE